MILANRISLSKEVVVRSTVRSVTALAVALFAVIGVAGCSAPFSSASNCVNPLGTGAASTVGATGAFDAKPAVTFPTTLVGRHASTATLTAGNGDVVLDKDYVDFEATVYAGKDHTLLTATSYGSAGAAPQRIAASSAGNTLSQSFLCRHVGDRFAVVSTIKDIFGNVSQPGILPTDTVVLVIDAVGRYPHSASGWPGMATDGLPAVTVDPNGLPGIARPTNEAPTTLLTETLVRGGGRIIRGGDTVVANYLGVLWDGTVFDSTYSSGQPANLVAQSFVTHDSVGVVPGLAKALVGQRVGSRIVVAIPPADGYPKGQEPQSIPAGSTLIFVVDVLGIQR